ncbi:putative quinol monooxygenase [Streptomyces sp. NPDC055134]
MNTDTTASDARHIICTVRAQTAHRDKVQELLLELVGPARAEPGCLYYDIIQQTDEPDTFYIVDGWASHEAIAEHTVHPNVARVVDQLAPLLAVPLHVTTSIRVSDA